MKNGLLKGLLYSTLAVCVAGALHAQRGPGGGAGGQHPGGMPGGQPSTGFGGPSGTGGFPAGTPPAPKSGDVPRGAATQSALGPPGRWWDDRNLAMSIGLRKDQQRKMDAIFNKNKPAILESYNTFRTAESKLQGIMKEPQPDKDRLFAQIDAVGRSRAALEKVYMQMQLQVRQEMQPDQIARLDKLSEKPPDAAEN
jgi:Spy/CpxP family protein refolding chaperone